jgi:hypothetical protein
MSRITQELKDEIHDLIVDRLGIGHSIETIKGAVHKSIRSRMPKTATSDSDKVRECIDFLSDLGPVRVADPLKAFLLRAAETAAAMPEAARLREIAETLPAATAAPAVDDDSDPLTRIQKLGNWARRYWLWAIGIVALLLVIYGFRPPNSDISFHVSSSELVLDENGNINERKPFAGASLAIRPANFDMQHEASAQTNAAGIAQFTIQNASLSPGVDPEVHFFVTESPEHLRPKGTLITTQFAAVLEGESVKLLSKNACKIQRGAVINVDVVPETLAPRYYALKSLAKLDELMTDPESGMTVSERYLQAQSIVDDEGWDDEKGNAEIRNIVARGLLEARPSITLSELPKADKKIHQLGLKVTPSVCYVTATANGGASQIFGSGFVVAKDLVVTTSFGTDDDFQAVGFGSNPIASEAKLPVKEFWRYPEFSVALLSVPGVNMPPLELAAENPFLSGGEAKIAVVGYCSMDRKVPETFRAALWLEGTQLKRVMPGECLAVDPTGERYVAMRHDATTTAGVAGSPLIDLSTGLVVGVHTSGSWAEDQKSNGAIPIWEILGDKDFAQRIGHERRLAIRTLSENDWVPEIESYDGHELLRLRPTVDDSPRWVNCTEMMKAFKTPLDLDLTDFPNSNYSIADLPEIESLHTLRIRSNDNFFDLHWLRRFKSLVRLFLTDCPNVRPFQVDGIATGDSFSRLQVLGLSGSAAWAVSLQHLSIFPNIEEVDLSNRLEPFSLSGIQSVPFLMRLRLANSGQVEGLQQISEHPSIQTITLDDSSFLDGQYPDVSGFRKRKSPSGIEYVREGTPGQ